MRSIPLLACLLLVPSASSVVSAEPPATAAPAASDSIPSSYAAPVAASPLAVLAAFERAWLAGAGDSVLACMSEQSIELALHRGGPPGGHFPPSQAAYLIEDLLHYGGTTEFRVVRFEWKEDAPPGAEIAWTHRVAGDEMREKLAVRLAFEDGAWRVVCVAAH